MYLKILVFILLLSLINVESSNCTKYKYDYYYPMEIIII